MEIRKARLADLEILLKMYESARMFMTSHGNPTQWGSTYPPKALLAQDIEDGNSYVRGAASFCLNWALEQCRNLRIDTHRDNVVMQHMLDKNGFQYCGIIYLEDGSERMGYQKRM